MNDQPASADAGETLKAQAQAQLREGLFDEAIETFSACLAVEPRDAKALQGRAIARFQLQKWTEASADFDAAKRLNPDDPENWIGFGMSLAMQNQVYPAIDVFDALLAKQPRCVRGYIQLGLLYFQLGIIAKGREQMQRALEHRPTLAERRLIESTLKEQNTLDKKRYYRPDFEALRRRKEEPPAP